MSDALFSSYNLGELELDNRVVMAPLTRSRAIDNLPNALMAEYYAQRASAGLIITEGTAPSPNGLGYPRIPGLFSEAQVDGWKLVTEAVHERGGKIFAQLMHVGRIGHPLNLPQGAELVGASPIAAPGQMYTDAQGPQPHPTPREMTSGDIADAVGEYVQATKNALAAGFDGVELHAANGYLLDQFLNPHANQRTDAYGGSAANRARFLLEAAEATIAAVGKDRVGVRLSPHNPFNGLGTFDGAEDAFVYTAEQLSKVGVVYLHIANMSAIAGYEFSTSTRDRIRQAFERTLILNGDYDRDRAQAGIAAGHGDLVAFGRPYVSNPDVVERLRVGAELALPNPDTLYSPGPEGYTDYPALEG